MSSTPLWKTPTRQQALERLTLCRESIDSLIAQLSAKQLVLPTVLGDGAWSIKDLLAHLATWEERAVEVGRALAVVPTDFSSVDAFNAHHLEVKRQWSLRKVQKYYADTRSELVALIEGMEDELWMRKIDTGSGRSALALVLAKLLVGGRFGFFAHDLAHRDDLERAVQSLIPPP